MLRNLLPVGFSWGLFSPFPPPLWMAVDLAGSYVILIVLFAEILNRFSPSPAEVTRKIVHIGVGQVVLLAWWLAIPGWVAAIAGILAAGVAIASYFWPILPSLESVGRRSYGTLCYALSIGILVGGFFTFGEPVYAAIGILVMAWGDGLAALVGQRWGRHPYTLLGSKKSWEGTSTMALVSFGITALLLGLYLDFPPLIWPIAAIVAGVSTTLESFSQWGIDNFTVPVGSAGLAFLLVQGIT